jgi:hypothetical protein
MAEEESMLSGVGIAEGPEASTCHVAQVPFKASEGGGAAASTSHVAQVP